MTHNNFNVINRKYIKNDTDYNNDIDDYKVKNYNN